MDLISIAQTLWRRKLLVIPVLVLTAALAIYTIKIKPPTYEAIASVLLTNPPGQASVSQISEDPGLKQVSPYNTFVSYGDLRVVANTVMDLINAPSSQPALTQAGVGPNYQLALSGDYGNPPIIVITGVGKSAQAAMTSASALVNAVKQDLYTLQKGEGINQFYMIRTLEVVKPTQAERSSSGKLRSLISVLGLGVVLIFLVVSVADVADKRRKAGISLTAGFPRVGGRRYPRGDGDGRGQREQESTSGSRGPRYAGRDGRDDPRDGRGPVMDDSELTRSEASYHNGSAFRSSNDMERQQRDRMYPAAPGYPPDY